MAYLISVSRPDSSKLPKKDNRASYPAIEDFRELMNGALGLRFRLSRDRSVFPDAEVAFMPFQVFFPASHNFRQYRSCRESALHGDFLTDVVFDIRH